MRGTRIQAVVQRRCRGIIPAYAGNTCHRRGHIIQHRDHPRVCGEHRHFPYEGVHDQGSSPRMRGTLSLILPPISLTGIIPAYAGNTIIPPPLCFRQRDHPRVCGEHIPQMPCVTHGAGSSPRMRGTRIRLLESARTLGIIPAYAGNTDIEAIKQLVAGDHPRVCGEHFWLMVLSVPLPGSSPRMRGTLAYFKVERRYYGIIPAYAGNTHQSPTAHVAERDHPRVCGEHIPTAGGIEIVVGIIPAYAGNTRPI